MSDQPSDPNAPPPPPPTGGYQPPPGTYQPPPPAGYQPPPGTYQPPRTPSPMSPTQMAGGGAAGIMSQFRGPALWPIGIGSVTIVAPFTAHFAFYLLSFVRPYYPSLS